MNFPDFSPALYPGLLVLGICVPIIVAFFASEYRKARKGRITV